jgi:hypothetical protein
MLDKSKFAASFAGDVAPEKADFMANSQVPWGVVALNGAVTEAAWRSKPSWYLVVTDHRMLPPPAQRAMSKRAGSSVDEVKGSHAVYGGRLAGSGGAPVEDSVRPNSGDGRRACLAHDGFELARIDIEHRFDSFLTERSEPPTLGPADANRGRSERQRLVYVRASANSAVHQHRYATFHRLDDFRHTVDGCAQRFLVAPTVIRDDDCVGSVCHSRLGILTSDYSLDEQLAANDAAQSIEPIESQSRWRKAAYARYVKP